MARSIRQVKYGDVNPSKILFGDGIECKRVYAGDVMVWNKDNYAFTIKPSTLNAEPTEATYSIVVNSTNDDRVVLVPYTATSLTDWITVKNNGNEIVVSADDTPREGATESLRIDGDAYVSNAGGPVKMPEIKCIWKNTTKRNGEVTYKQGEDSELTATLSIEQKLGSGEGTYHIEAQSTWLHVDDDNNVTADPYYSPTLSREGSLVIISDLTGEVETLTIHQANILEQKKEYGIFSQLENNTLTIPCTGTQGDAKLVIRRRYYQINAETGERIPASETAWIDTDIKSWIVQENVYFRGDTNTSEVTCTNNIHKLTFKQSTLQYTIQVKPGDIEYGEVSDNNLCNVDVIQLADEYINNNEIFTEYRINEGSIPEINAAGTTVTATINSEYRRYKVWKSDNARDYFENDTWKNDIGATFVSQSISGYVYYYNEKNVSSTPNTDPANYREGVGRFISNRIMNGQPLYIDLTINQKYREKTSVYQFINPELTVDGKALETWNATAASQSKSFNVVSKVLRQYKWTDGNWYDNVPNTKENWDYSSIQVDWCSSTNDLNARTTTLTLTPNHDIGSRNHDIVIKQKEDVNLAAPLDVTIKVVQTGRVPNEVVTPPGTDPIVPSQYKRLKDCAITVSPNVYSPNAGAQSKNDFDVSSTAIVEYLYSDGNWYAEPNRYKVEYTASSNASDWCTPSVQVTQGHATVTVNANSNTTNRSAVITFTQKYSAHNTDAKKSCTLTVNQDGNLKDEDGQIQWKNASISVTPKEHQFGYEGGTVEFTVTSKADKWCKYTDGNYYLVSSDVTMPYTSSPTTGEIKTNGAALVTATQYTSATDRSQTITFTQNSTGVTDTVTIKQKGDAPKTPEQWEDRNYVLTVSPTTWNINTEAQSKNDFTYVSTKDRYQLWVSGWKKMETVDVGVSIETASASGDIKITSAANGKVAISATANNDATNSRTKTVKIIQDDSNKDAAIVVTQAKAELVTSPSEQSKFREDGYTFSINPTSYTWLQTENDAKSITATSYGYRVYLYSDGVYRGKVNKDTTGDKVVFTDMDVSGSTHWNVSGSGLTRSFSPKSNADKNYDETITFTQKNSDGSTTGKTANLSIFHKHAKPLSPTVEERRNYTISITAPSKPLNITTCGVKETAMTVDSKCDVYIKYDDGNFYFSKKENVDFTVSPSAKQNTNNYCYSDKSKIYTKNIHSTNQLSETITVTQNAGSNSKSDSITVTVAADTKSAEKYEYRISGVTVPNIPYTGNTVTANVVNEKRSYKTWGSDNAIVDQGSWVTDADAVVSSTYVSGSTAIQSDGSLRFWTSENTGTSERIAYFKFSNNHGATYTDTATQSQNIAVTQVTNTYTKYKMSVTPSSYTFKSQSNGTVRLSVTCQYCICTADSEGTWNDCDYTVTTNPNDSTYIKYTKSTTTAWLKSNVHSETAFSGDLIFKPNDMSATTGYAGPIKTTTVTLNGYKDEILSASEYKITDVTIPTIPVSGGSVTATISCQQQDYKYWKSGGIVDRHSTTKAWYAITTPSEVSCTKVSGNSNIKGSGLNITGTSNSGTTTSEYSYNLIVSGGNASIPYNSASSDDFTVTQQKKTKEDRSKTSSRSAQFYFTVPFPTGTQKTDKATATQLGDSGYTGTWPSTWSADTTKNHTITGSGTDFIALSEPTSSNGVWTYTASWDNNAGSSFTGTEYRMRLSTENVNMGYDQTSAKITVNNEKRDVTGGRNSTDSRTKTYSVSYKGESGSVSFTQAGDTGSKGNGSGTWSVDSGATLSSVIVGSPFTSSKSGNSITIQASDNSAVANTETNEGTKVTNTSYKDYTLSIKDATSNISASGGSSSHSVTATRTQVDTVQTTMKTTYTTTYERSASGQVTNSRGKTATFTVVQAGQSKSPTYRYPTDTKETKDKSYTPSLTWVSDYPKGTGASKGTAPSISASANNSGKRTSSGTKYKLTVGSIDSFSYSGGTKTPSLTFEKADEYYYVNSDSRTLTGKCYDSVGGVYSNEFTVVQNGGGADSKKITDSWTTDTSSSATVSVSDEGFSKSGTTGISASPNTNTITTTEYRISVNGRSSDSVTDLEGEIKTPTILSEEQKTDTEYSTNSRSGSAKYSHSKSGASVIYPNNASSLTLSQEGKTITGGSKTTPRGWTTSAYTSSSNNTSVATVSGNSVKLVSPGNAIITFACKNDSTKKAYYNVTVTNKIDENDLPGPYVEIAGVSWASCNLGAKMPCEYGDYYMWGSTKPNTNDNCAWENAPFNNGSSTYDKSYFESIKDTVCPNGVLAPKYDAIYQSTEGFARMPTLDEINSLYDKTNRKVCECSYMGGDHAQHSVKGMLFTSKEDESKKFFIPYAGFRVGETFNSEGSSACLWTTSLASYDDSMAAYLYFYGSGTLYPSTQSRCYGHSLRGVKNSN